MSHGLLKELFLMMRDAVQGLTEMDVCTVTVAESTPEFGTASTHCKGDLLACDSSPT